jgi:hypothetical protein
MDRRLYQDEGGHQHLHQEASAFGRRTWCSREPGAQPVYQPNKVFRSKVAPGFDLGSGPVLDWHMFLTCVGHYVYHM